MMLLAPRLAEGAGALAAATGKMPLALLSGVLLLLLPCPAAAPELQMTALRGRVSMCTPLTA